MKKTKLSLVIFLIFFYFGFTYLVRAQNTSEVNLAKEMGCVYNPVGDGALVGDAFFSNHPQKINEVKIGLVLNRSLKLNELMFYVDRIEGKPYEYPKKDLTGNISICEAETLNLQKNDTCRDVPTFLGSFDFTLWGNSTGWKKIKLQNYYIVKNNTPYIIIIRFNNNVSKPYKDDAYWVRLASNGWSSGCPNTYLVKISWFPYGGALHKIIFDMRLVGSTMENYTNENISQISKKVHFKLFVMSFCPFSNKVEKVLKEVYEYFGNKVEWEVHYVIYPSSYYKGKENQFCIGNYCSMHGVQELYEDMREMCIWKYYPTLWWNFVTQVNDMCDVSNISSCWKIVANKTGINVERIEECVEKNGTDMLSKEIQIEKEYNVSGSPTFFINDIRYTGNRTFESFKNAILLAMNLTNTNNKSEYRIISSNSTRPSRQSYNNSSIQPIQLSKVVSLLETLKQEFSQLKTASENLSEYYVNTNQTKSICWKEVTLLLESEWIKIDSFEAELKMNQNISKEDLQALKKFIKELKNDLTKIVNKIFVCSI